jgi:Flp pilus assembly protein TadD
MPGPAKLWPVWGVLVTVVWVAFSPVLTNGFVDWDDPWWILDNHAFRGLGWEQVRFAFTTLTGGVYQPLGWLIQSVTYVFYGLSPRGYHLVSLLFHLVNVVLLHLLCVRLVATRMPEMAERLGGGLGWLCAVPVGLYAVHPLRVETVAWASCQAYLPSITFSLLATLAYLRAHPAGGAVRRSSMIGSSVLIVLAVLTKGSAVVLPFVFLILDAYPLRRINPGHPSWPTVRKVLIEKGPILVFCLAFTAVAFEAKRYRVEPEPEIAAQPVLVGRVAQASFGAWFYLEKTIWPFGLAAYYPRPEGEDFRTPLFVACFAGISLAMFAAFRLRRRCPWLLAAVAAYLVIASPYLGLVRVATTLATDHYGHAPIMVWVVLACGGLGRLAQRRWSRSVVLWAAAGTLAVVAGSMALCSAQCRIWDSNEHLWAHALEQARWSSKLHDFMGTTFAEEGKLDRAIAEFREALRINPHDFDTRCNLGVALDRRGETDAAIAYLREAASLRPENAKVRLNLGGALVHRERVEEAIATYREALRLQPGFPDLHFSLGVALIQQQKLDEAIEELTRAVGLRPWYHEAHAALGGALALRGRQDEAVIQYRQAIGLSPDDSVSRINLGLALARQGRTAEAIAELRDAIRRDRRNPEAHHILAAVLVAAGRIEEAAPEFEEVLYLRPDHPQARAFLARMRGRRM